MVRKRVVGRIGPEEDGTAVMTAWEENPPDGLMRGIQIGLDIRGWEDTEIEEAEDA